MAFIKFNSIVDAKYDPQNKLVILEGEMDLTGEIYMLIAEGYLEDFCTRQEQIYTFDLTQKAEFNYCMRWVDKQVGDKNKGLSFTKKLQLLKGKTMITLIDPETVRASYAQYMKDLEKKNKKKTK